jgi:2-polyprenyl-6-methoxyphenol hydroxylase-like FAD-dependent oxidoreductase
MATEETDVLIVGAGLAGLATAVFLGLHGVPALVVERHAGTSVLPKARGQNPVTMEALRTAGLADAIRAAAPPGKPGITSVISESMAGRVLYDHVVNRPDFTRFSPEKNGMTSQARAEVALAARASDLGAQLLFNTVCEAIVQDPDGVTVTVKSVTTNESRKLRARYVVAADGIRGELADQLGVKKLGRGLIKSVTAVRFLADLSALAGDNSMVIHYVQNPALPDGAGVVVKTDNPGEWVANMSADPNRDDVATAEVIRTLVGVPDLKLEIIGSVSFDYGHQIADRFKIGRVLLTGDAAHVMPPTGGQGGNAAVQDGYYLGWKLAAVVRGLAGPELLETYDPERRPYVEAVCNWQVANLAERRALDLAKEVGEPMDHATLLFGYACPEGAIVPDPKAGNATFEHPADPSGKPGSRVPYVKLRSPDGGEVSPRELLGPYFVAFSAARGGVTSAVTAAEELGIELKAYAVDSVAPLGAGATDTVLVRPDGVVAWRGSDTGDIGRALRAVLYR